MVSKDKIDGVDINLDDLINIQSRLGGLSLRHLKRLNKITTGSGQIRHRGRGMEYQESRAYVVGDDNRIMDWRVMARTGEAHTKIFSEEKEPCLTLVVDLSPSMFYGTDTAFKSWAAIQLAAHFAWLCHFEGNRLGALIASPGHIVRIKPITARRGLLNLLQQLVDANQQRLPISHHRSQLNDLLSDVRQSLTTGSGVVLISDFLGITSQTAELLRNLNRNQRVSAYRVYDRSEVESWIPGCYPLVLEDKYIILDTHDRSSLNWLVKQQKQNLEQITGTMAELNIELQSLCCNFNITRQLLSSLN
jgi:uncharacterized protein (DUF58 family)